MNKEKKVLDKYFGAYYIYADGRVQRISTGRYLKHRRSARGYMSVELHAKLGKGVQKYIHRLLAEHFIPNPNDYPCVNHKDGNASNNSISNLEWCTQQQNMLHALESKLFKCRRRAKKIECANCNKSFMRRRSRLSKQNYCSFQCYKDSRK